MKLTPSTSDRKKSELERLLGMGMVMVFVDTRHPDVKVPDEYKGLPQLSLNLSYRFQIPDFQVYDDRTECTLTFPTGKFFCVVPFKALYGIRSVFAGEIVLFPEDTPQELIPSIAPEASATTAPVSTTISPPVASKASPIFKVVESNETPPEEPVSPLIVETKPKKKRKSHLKLVKTEDS